LGYNHIFIYDNNDKDGERLEDVIQKYIDEGFVSITDYRGDRNRLYLEHILTVMKKIVKNMIGYLFLILMNS
jgi:hypothetical protein